MSTPKEEAERLLKDVLPFAQQMLRQHGEFFPYGAFLRPDGSIVHVGAEDPTTDRPRSVDVIKTLRAELHQRVEREEANAAAIVFDVRVIPPGEEQKSDAIEVLVQHRDSYCAEVFFPYRLDGQSIKFGQTFAQACESPIFAVDGS